MLDALDGTRESRFLLVPAPVLLRRRRLQQIQHAEMSATMTSVAATETPMRAGVERSWATPLPLGLLDPLLLTLEVPLVLAETVTEADDPPGEGEGDMDELATIDVEDKVPLFEEGETAAT
jgi:hypothetical protein